MSNYIGIAFLVFSFGLLQKVASSEISRALSNELLFEQVDYGDNVVLKCRSNDLDHNFEYWLLENPDIIIGPANEDYDNSKYKYEILSGNLIVRGITKNEEGIYTCISRAVKGNNIRKEKVRMILKQDWDTIHDHVMNDHQINIIKILIVLIALVLLVIAGFVIFRMWRDRFRYIPYSEHDDGGESADEMLESPTTSGISRSRSPGRIVLENDKSTDNNTDFKTFLDTANNK
ncbi:hypothetical protein JTB14_009920 [Gonioctena quinquepunctata]|nr:hypothetical protein JTB14_009920 [Gonioctena quinquepunctata]